MSTQKSPMPWWVLAFLGIGLLAALVMWGLSGAPL